MSESPQFDRPTCPVPLADYEQVVLGHGSGGRLSAGLVRQLFLPAFDNPVLAALEDQATVTFPGASGTRLAFTTDAFVVRPIFFPGGDIGRLAVCGTVNDLAMMGAVDPLGLTLSVVLEEGYVRADLERIAASIRAAAAEAGASVLTGDTKVMGRGELDGILRANPTVSF